MIKNKEFLTKHGNREARKILLMLADSLLENIRADKIVKEYVSSEDNALQIMEKRIPLNFRRIFVVGFGKAAVPMARAMENILEDKIHTGMVNSPYPARLERIKVNVASHPLPDERTLNASRKILEMVKEAGKDDLLIVLVSGGASSLFEVPRNGITLGDEKEVIKKSMLSGMDVIELNKLRISLSSVKGGKFLKFVAPAKCISLIISDVIGPPEFVGSGPTYGEYRNCENFVLADNRYALKKAKDIAEEMGLRARISPITLRGEPRNMAKVINRDMGKGITIWGGETVVKATAQGKGGRNQELALYLAREIKDRNEGFLCMGTDGIDGPTDAAGGIVDGSTLKRIGELGMNLEEMLSQHDSYKVLKELRDLIITGYTGTNLADICLGYRP